MSTFNYEDLQNAQQNRAQSTQTKVGYFKLNDGAEALVRINCASTNDLAFQSVHTPVFPNRWSGLNSTAGVSCLNAFGDNSDNCPFCRAARLGHPVISKAASKVYIEMLVAYINLDGTISQPQPMIWERPSGFAREIANKLRDYGNLKETLLKISRTGSGKDTRYSLDYAMPARYNPALIPTDFSAFNNLRLDKHSYWVKTAEEMETYIQAGQFPEIAKEGAQVVQQAPVQAAPVNPAPAAVPFPEVATPAQPTGQTYERAPWLANQAPAPETPQEVKPAVRVSNYTF